MSAFTSQTNKHYMNDHSRIDTLHLFPVLDDLLIPLLQSLSDEEWQAQTVAKLWKVKDVASHLLDGNLRGLSMLRDGYFGEKPEGIHSNQDLVAFLNKLNMSWTQATRRLSPRVLIDLLAITGQQYAQLLKTLDPNEPAVFSVAWAGQDISPNWFHIAREYTEKFLHQQQIRDAVGRPGLLVRELFYPFIDTLMRAFPHTFKDIPAPNDTVVSIVIDTGIGGRWSIVKTGDHWQPIAVHDTPPAAMVIIDPDTAWKLFSKSWRPQDVLDRVEISGDERLGRQALEMVSFMA